MILEDRPCLQLLTLYFGILGHQQKSPSQCCRRCVGAGGKEVLDRPHEVVIVEVTVGNTGLLHTGSKGLDVDLE